MSEDTISRQAAIEALARTAREKFNLSDEFNHQNGKDGVRWKKSAKKRKTRVKPVG